MDANRRSDKNRQSSQLWNSLSLRPNALGILEHPRPRWTKSNTLNGNPMAVSPNNGNANPGPEAVASWTSIWQLKCHTLCHCHFLLTWDLRIKYRNLQIGLRSAQFARYLVQNTKFIKFWQVQTPPKSETIGWVSSVYNHTIWCGAFDSPSSGNLSIQFANFGFCSQHGGDVDVYGY